MIRTLYSLVPPGSRRLLTVHFGLTVLGVTLRAVGVVLLVPLLDALFGPSPADAWPWVAWTAAVTVVGWVVDARAARLGFDLGFSVLGHAQREVSERISRIRLTWFTDDNIGTARQAIAATGPELVGIFTYLVTPLIGAVLLPVVIAVALVPISWVLAVAAIAGIPLLFGALAVSDRLSRNAERSAAETNVRLTERIVEFARTQQVLRAARRAAPERSRVGEALAAQHASTMRLLSMQIPGRVAFSVASRLALLILAGTVVWSTVRGDLAVAEAIALIAVIVRYLESFTVLADLAPGLEPSLTALRRIRAVLSAPVRADGGSATVGGHPPRIELRNIGFWYGPNEEPVLDGLDLAFEPGTTTAIVGPSGSGKSTLLALLAGLHEPRVGQILVDGIDLADLDRESRESLVSVVFQDPYLFDGTIRESIRVGDRNVDDDAIDTAAALARVDDIVARAAHGWETRVGEGGAAMSGGERQRISIARALVKPAPVLLVDEATSALDNENEAAVVQTTTADPTPRTRVIVAHRLASIRSADRVVFLEHGGVVEDGTVDGLLAAGGRFAAFWKERRSAAQWRL